MALTACSSDDSPIEPTVERVPVRLGHITVDAAETRAAQHLNEGTLDAGERVMVRISNTDAEYWTNYTYTSGDNGDMIAPAPGPYYPEGGQHIDIAAYLPATAGTSFTVAADQISDEDFKASELLFASVTDQAIQTEAVELAFKHKMAKICVNATVGEGVGSINEINILNVHRTVSFNQTTDEVGVKNDRTTHIILSNNGAAVIPAQTINGRLLAIKTDKGTATYSVAEKTFAAGHLYNLNITVNSDAVGIVVPITGWTDDEAVTVNPEVIASYAPAGAEAVDLGLSVLWANMNVGATDGNGNGTYFA